MKIPFITAALFLVFASVGSRAELKTEHFDRDPGWEGHNNHIEPKHLRTVAQNFGYDPAGKIGGTIWRSTTPAFYAEKIAPKTLRDKFTASGAFAFTASSGSSGMFFGWFNSKQAGGTRPVGSLGLDFDGENHGLRLAVRLISAANKSCGTFITPFIPGKFRPTPIKNDGTRYHWTLSYDPAAGTFQFTIKSSGEKHEEFEGKTFTVDVPQALKEEGTVFDRFGMVNMGCPGHALTVFFDDLQNDGKKLDLSRDPNWEGSGNRVTFVDQEEGGAQNFGFSPTSFAGGRPGEIGGAFWRTEKDFGYYGDRIGALTLEDRLEGSGKIMLAVGAPDSAACLGWFKSDAGDRPPDRSSNFLGVVITGPTRVGHYFSPAYTTAKGTRGNPKSGPVLVPGQTHQWTLLYDPKAAGGQGSMQITLDKEKFQFDLTVGHKAEGGQFDRFGLFSTYPGGGLVRMWLDDLRYTAGTNSPAPVPNRIWQDEIVYVIVVQKFCNGDTNNDLMLQRFGATRDKYEGGFWGGDLAGIRQKLDYLKELGVTAVLLYPVFQNDTGPFAKYLATGYRPIDYFKIDENFGDEAALRDLVTEAHARHLKVILDMPLGIPGVENPVARDPTHKDWLGAWTPYGLQQWNATNTLVADYLISVCKFWLEHSGCDGFRMDSSHMHPASFWKRCNQEIRAAAKGDEPIVIGELPVDPVKIGHFVAEGGFTSAYDFNFETVRSVLGKSGNAGELNFALAGSEKAYPQPARMMAQIDAYENPAFMDVAAEPKIPRLLAAMTFLLTMDRVPLIYSGDECALAYHQVGELFAKRTPEQIAFRERVKQLTALRRREPALRRGSFALVPAGNDVFAYLRQVTEPDRSVLVVINCSGEPRAVRPAGPGQDWKKLQLRDLLSDKLRKTAGTDAPLSLSPFEAAVLRIN